MSARNRMVWMTCVLTSVMGVLSARGDAVGGYKGFTWRISAGAFSRSISSTHVDPGSRTTEADVPSVSTAVRGPAANVGPEKALGSRTYDNGHVGMDAFAATYGSTLNWGVSDPNTQIKGNAVTMTAADGAQNRNITRQPASEVSGSSDSGSASEWGQSIQVEFGYSANTTTTWSVLGAMSSLQSSRGTRQTSFSEQQSWVDVNRQVVDTFTRTGSFIQNIPTTREYTESNGRSHSTRTENVVEQHLNFDLRTISLGISRDQHWKGLDFVVAAGPTVNIVQSDVTRSETVYVSQDGGTPTLQRAWHDAQSEDKVLPGCFIQGSAGLRLGRIMHAGLLGRYDLCQSYKGQLGPSDYKTSLNGFSLGAAISWDL